MTNTVMKMLRNSRKFLTRQQYKTLKGQALSGDIDGALKGLQTLFNRAQRVRYESRN